MCTKGDYENNKAREWLVVLLAFVSEYLKVFQEGICDSHEVKEVMKGYSVVFHLVALIAMLFRYHFPDVCVNMNI